MNQDLSNTSITALTEVNPGNATIILAGATGALGRRIGHALLERGATVKALVRPGTPADKCALLSNKGAMIAKVDLANHTALTQACAGGTCIVSALSGLQEVIVDAQQQLLDAAIEAGVPRFIPSEYCIDYTKLPPGHNRNLDLRRAFAARLDNSPIQATSILNGMFTDLLTGQAPVVLQGLKRILYWGNREQLLDFTTMDDTAAYTAAAALDAHTPRYLRIAGEVVNVQGLQEAAGKAYGKHFRLFRAGGLGTLRTMIKVTRTLMPKKEEVFPPWQGMQYLHDMFSGRVKLHPLDNDRYRGLWWTSVEDVLKRAQKQPDQ